MQASISIFSNLPRRRSQLSGGEFQPSSPNLSETPSPFGNRLRVFCMLLDKPATPIPFTIWYFRNWNVLCILLPRHSWWCHHAKLTRTKLLWENPKINFLDVVISPIFIFPLSCCCYQFKFSLFLILSFTFLFSFFFFLLLWCCHQLKLSLFLNFNFYFSLLIFIFPLSCCLIFISPNFRFLFLLFNSIFIFLFPLSTFLMLSSAQVVPFSLLIFTF